MEVLVADEADEMPAFGNVRVDLGRWSVRQPPHRSGGDVGEVKIAIDGHQDRLGVRRPFIFDDSLGSADAGALAAHLLGFGNLPAAELGRIDEHPLGAGGRVERPEIEALAIIGTRLQEGCVAAVRRQLQLARSRARKLRAREDSLDGERLRDLGWRGGGDHERRCRKQEKTHGRTLTSAAATAMPMCFDTAFHAYSA